MTNIETELQSVDAAVLSEVVCVATDYDKCEVTRWSYKPVGGQIINPVSGGIYRFIGEARSEVSIFEWSLVLKIINWVDFSGTPMEKGYMTEPSDWNYWKREALVYENDLLEERYGNLVPVTCYQVSERSDTVLFLWLEDVVEPEDYTWTFERHVLAAQHFGELNGLHAANSLVTDYDWLNRKFIRQFSNTGIALGAVKNIENPATWQTDIVKIAFPYSVSKNLLQIFDRREKLFQVLEALPQTLSHLDTSKQNVFSRQANGSTEQTVVIDWALLGHAAVGEDLGNQISGDLPNLVVDPAKAHEYESQAFDAYMEGLHNGGWRGKPEQVRFGYLANASMRGLTFGCFMLGQLVNNSTEKTWVDNWADRYNCSAEDIAVAWGRAMSHMIDMGIRAHDLIDEISW